MPKKIWKKWGMSRNCRKAIGKNLGFYLIMTIFFFCLAGRFSVWRGWIYYLLIILGAILNNLFLLRFNPEVLDFRADEGSATETWDKVILGSYFLVHILFITGLAGFGARRGWPELPVLTILPGVLLYLVSLTLSTWAMAVNRHFEGTVRIQTERNHTVITKGPYQYIRHPGNLGMALSSLVQPFIVGSPYALAPALAAIVLIVIRTHLEDKVLLAELEGYRKYAAKVRYRLLPKVW